MASRSRVVAIVIVGVFAMSGAVAGSQQQKGDGYPYPEGRPPEHVDPGRKAPPIELPPGSQVLKRDEKGRPTLVAVYDNAGWESGNDGSGPLHHWGHGYQPKIAVNCNDRVGGDSLCHFTGEAEYGWSVNGYPNGFSTGWAPRGCDNESGWIKTCLINPPNGYAGVAYNAYVYNPNPHLDSVAIHIRPDLTHTSAHRVVNHEYGHGLGLAHTACGDCVMHTPVYDKNQKQHDRDAMGATYGHRD